MEDVKELLQSRIEGISDPVQKVLLQDVLVDVFGELLRYSSEQFSQLEKRLDEEICDSSRLYYIDTGVCKRNSLDYTSRYLFEMKAGKNREKGYLGKLFLACDYPVICQCMQKPYQALVETDHGEFKTTVSLTYCKDYLETLEQFYRTFLANQRPWHTINCPFLYKFLAIVDREGIVPQDAMVEKVEIMFGELSHSVINDAVLVWNVQEEMHKPSVEIAAAEREAVNIHRISLPDEEAGYLAMPEGEDYFCTVFSKGELFVRTDKLDVLSMNPFIRSHSLMKKKRRLTIVLHAKDNTDIFRYEKMFFLLAELQLCTEEYQWTGILR